MVEYRLIRSRRKTIAVQISPEGEVIVRAPRLYAKYKIEAFLREKEGWIQAHLEKLRSVPRAPALSDGELKTLAKEAARWFSQRTAHFAPLVGVSYGRITIRSQRTRWGSCSGKGNLNFNCLLMLAPEKIRDYVVVHELCHRIEMNHSARFWSQVERILPDYREGRRWLKENGAGLMARLPGSA